MDLERILQLMQDLDPKVVIPMHYQIPGSAQPLGSLDAFLQLMGVSEVQPRRSLTVTTNSLPANMQVTILEPARPPRLLNPALYGCKHGLTGYTGKTIILYILLIRVSELPH